MLLPLEPLPQVYVVGPEYAVAWSGGVDQLADALAPTYQQLTPTGLAEFRENELTNRLNRAKAAFHSAEPLTSPDAASRCFTAAGLTSTVADATPSMHPLHRQAADLLDQIDKRGQTLLASASDLARQNNAGRAYEQLQFIAEGFYGRPASEQALQMLHEMETRPNVHSRVLADRDETSASRTLRMAEQALSEKRYADAERLYRMIGEVYPRTRAADNARRALANLRKDKAAATQLSEQKAEPQAPILLSLAARYAQMGQTDMARQYYQEVLRTAAGTTYARQAQDGLALLPAVAASQPAATPDKKR